MRRVIVTSGGTKEKIDSVRSITNSSTGALGSFIAHVLLTIDSLDCLYYVYAKGSKIPEAHPKLKLIEISDVKDLELNIKALLKQEIDCVIHAMAVSDYTVESVLDEYLKEIDNSNKISSSGNIYLKLKRTPKIVDLIKKLNPKTNLVSFKLLSGVSQEELIDVASKQLKRTDSSLVVANDLRDIKNANHKAYMVKADSIDVVRSKISIASYLKEYVKNIM